MRNLNQDFQSEIMASHVFCLAFQMLILSASGLQIPMSQARAMSLFSGISKAVIPYIGIANSDELRTGCAAPFPDGR